MIRIFPPLVGSYRLNKLVFLARKKCRGGKQVAPCLLVINQSMARVCHTRMRRAVCCCCSRLGQSRCFHPFILTSAFGLVCWPGGWIYIMKSEDSHANAAKGDIAKSWEAVNSHPSEKTLLRVLHVPTNLLSHTHVLLGVNDSNILRWSTSDTCRHTCSDQFPCNRCEMCSQLKCPKCVATWIGWNRGKC